MAPGGTLFRFTPHFGENVLPCGSHEWLPYSKKHTFQIITSQTPIYLLCTLSEKNRRSGRSGGWGIQRKRTAVQRSTIMRRWRSSMASATWDRRSAHSPAVRRPWTRVTM